MVRLNAFQGVVGVAQATSPDFPIEESSQATLLMERTCLMVVPSIVPSSCLLESDFENIETGLLQQNSGL